MMPRSAHPRRAIFPLDEDSIEIWAVAALLAMVVIINILALLFLW
jgi:hypothetical protein